MKRILLLAAISCAFALCGEAANVTNTVMMVNQRGELNVEGVATVADVATNAVKVAIASQAAETAQATANQVDGAINTVVENIMSNNVVIYRRGFADAFSALVIITPDDKLIITDARWVEKSAARIVVDIDYVCTADVAALKPIVYHRNTIDLGSERADFAPLADASVSEPAYHAGQRIVDDEAFAGYYTVTATIPNPAGITSYFLWISIDGNAPAGDGATLDLPNGVTGGVTGDFVWGDKILTFNGGILTEVSE